MAAIGLQPYFYSVLYFQIRIYTMDFTQMVTGCCKTLLAVLLFHFMLYCNKTILMSSSQYAEKWPRSKI